jgi:hypothetical protein
LNMKGNSTNCFFADLIFFYDHCFANASKAL